MDQHPPKRRFRFGLRRLLLFVAICAGFLTAYRAYRWVSQVTPSTLATIARGMSEDEVLGQLGSPNAIVRKVPQDIWYYDHDRLIARVYFYKNGQVAGVYYYDSGTFDYSGLP